MTTIITQRPNSLQLSRSQINNIIMFLAAIGIAAMVIATQPFGSPASRDRIDSPFSRTLAAVDPSPLKADWCCLGSKPAEILDKRLTDVDDVTSSVDNNPRLNPLAVGAAGLDPGVIDRLIGGTVYAGTRRVPSSMNQVR